MNNYKILSITDGIVEVEFNFEDYEKGKVKKIAGVPMDSAEAIDKYMSDWMNAYVAGKKQEKDAIPKPSDDVKNLIGKIQEVE